MYKIIIIGNDFRCHIKTIAQECGNKDQMK